MADYARTRGTQTYNNADNNSNNDSNNNNSNNNNNDVSLRRSETQPLLAVLGFAAHALIQRKKRGCCSS